MSATALPLVAAAAPPAALTPQSFVKALDESCPRCQPYLETLRELSQNPGRSQELFVANRRYWFPGASPATAKRLARRCVSLYTVYYRLLSLDKKPKSATALIKFLHDDQICGALRSSAAWALYLTNHRPRYAATALRLHGFEIKVFERTRDPNFYKILTILTKRAAATPPGTPAKRFPATLTMRYYYLPLVKAAMFQHVPDGIVERLFMLYRRMLVATPQIDLWAAGALRHRLVPARTCFSPQAGPLIAKAIAPYGAAREKLFFTALARQGLVLDLANVMQTIPAMRGEVRAAVRKVAESAHGKLRTQLLAFLKSPPRVSRRPWLTPSRREALKIYRQEQAARRKAKAHGLPVWLSVPSRSAAVPVSRADAFARANFLIHSKSHRAVKVVRLWTSCSCTSATTGEKIVEPGGTLHIRAKVRMRGLTPPLRRYVFVLLRRHGGAKSVRLRFTIRVVAATAPPR
jgi:hypothetical protein